MKKLTKFIFPFFIFIAITLSIILFFTLKDFNKIKVAFYKIPQNTQQNIVQTLQPLTDKKIKVFTINKNKTLNSKQAKKYDLIFTNNSRSAINLNSEPISQKTINKLPSKIRYCTMQNNQNYALPILLDHFELAVYKTYADKMNLSEPENLSIFTENLEKLKKVAPFPLIVIGSDDLELFGFVSAMAQSMYGANEYFELCNQLFEAQNQDQPLPLKLYKVLDQIKILCQNELLHKHFLELTFKDAEFLMKEHQIGAIATFLSTHRQLPYVLIKYYDSYVFPQESTEPQALIAPQLCVLKTSKEKDLDFILEALVSNDIQTTLSEKTMLAPTAAIAQSSDLQSDNVRFWSASILGGPVPTLDDTSFTNPEKIHKYTQLIRDYLK